MPSAHYQPIDPQQASDDDIEFDDGEDDDDDDSDTLLTITTAATTATPIAASDNRYSHIHYHPQLGSKEPLPAHLAAMAPRLNRSITAGARRCLFSLLFLAVLSIGFMYFIFNGPALGQDDAGDDYEPHNAIALGFGHISNESLHICTENYEDRRLYMQDQMSHTYALLPVIYFVTPTYPRREQIPELTRLAHTLLHVPRLHWLVANDREKCDPLMDDFLNRFGIPYTHLASPMPNKFRNSKPTPRGVANRRAALKWLQQHNITKGVLYFGDDDNTYDLKLFSEIRQTKRVSMFPVGLIADYAVSGPVVREGKVIAFLDSWVADRRWPVDMAGFAVNLGYMSEYPSVNMPYRPGYEEDLFLRSIKLRIDEIEPKGNNCTEILVWHTQTKSKKAAIVRLESKYLDGRSNLGALFKELKMMGVSRASDTEGPMAVLSKNGKEKSHAYFLSGF